MDKSTSGFRFNGESYVVIDGRSYLEEEKSSVEIRFSTYASDGLLFLIGKEDSFLSIELQNGSIFFQVWICLLLYFVIFFKILTLYRS